MLCSKCCEEIPDESIICPECGNTVSSTSSDTSDGMKRKRHGFTSFYLIFSLTVAIAMIIAACYFFAVYGEPLLFVVAMFIIIIAIPQVVGIILLLRWKKVGFWVYAGSFLLPTIYIVGIGSPEAILIALVFIVIMWAVL